MIPSTVPNEHSGLTQVEEMLIARALPIMHIFFKKGGQRGYSGHCFNLPQNVHEIAKSLPRYPKDLSVIVVKIKGKESTFKTLNVRRQLLADALFWLLKHNDHRYFYFQRNAITGIPTSTRTFPKPHPQAPLHLIINGEAGTSKFYLIKALRNVLGQSCILTATTGKASFNIDAITIHSSILIDEYSMLRQRLFGWVDKRCRQPTGKINPVFGDISIILFGDPAQLPPVADKPLYHSKPAGALGEQGYLAYLMFTKVIKLSVNQRVQGSDVRQVTFKNLLRRLRKGDCTNEDWQLLLTRQPSKP